MFNVGGGELLVIMLVALIVLGPQRLPDAARQIGKTMGELRRLSAGFQNEMKGALDFADDPARVSPRRNVLGPETSAPVATPTARLDATVADETPVTTAIAAVSQRPPARATTAARGATKAPARTTKAKTKPVTRAKPVTTSTATKATASQPRASKARAASAKATAASPVPKTPRRRTDP